MRNRAASAWELIRRLQPDVVLIDANITLPDAPQILQELKADRCKTRICFLTEDQIAPILIEVAMDGAACFASERFPEKLREIAVHLKSQEPLNTEGSSLPADTGFSR
jgi:DNA-binding NarL/FixJ family response regulator